MERTTGTLPRPPRNREYHVLVVLIASSIIDPLVLLGLLHTLARSQVDTEYRKLFSINLGLAVVALAILMMLLPIDLEEGSLPVSAQIGVALVLVLTVALIAHYCQLSVLRAVLVSLIFWVYKSAVAYGLIFLLAVFGLEIDFGGVDLDSLGGNEAPAIFDWFLEHGLWFKTKQP